MAIKGVLLDLGGVVLEGERALPGAPEALAKLRAAGLPLRCITNTTRRSRRQMLEDLHAIGLHIGADELFMPAIAARTLLLEQGLRPHLLVHPNLEEDFAGTEGAAGGLAVVVGDAAEGFTYGAMNAAFRALMEGAAFYALAKNRAFKDADGALSIDAGAFVAALEYATKREAAVLGKPAEGFFAAALSSLGLAAGEVVMIGDDAEADVAGAMRCGLQGVLVQTGKYLPGDEKDIAPSPTAVLCDFPTAVEWLLKVHRNEKA